MTGRSLARAVGWPFVQLLLGAIRLYQLTLSPLLPRACRFEPTCSRYAALALRRHGLVRGLALTAWRLLRCQPFCEGGLDPVPEHVGCGHEPTATPGAAPDKPVL